MASQKLAFVVFDQGVEPDVMTVMDKHEIKHYTRWTDAFGAGVTGIKEGTPIWPGLNTVLMVYLPEDKVAPFVAALHEVRDSFPVTPGMKVFVVDAQMM
jgi:hypothetical protein